MNPSTSGPTPLNPRGGGGRPEPAEGAERGESAPAPEKRSETSISNEAQAVRTLASAHRLAGEIENEARRRASEITAQAELEATQRERDARARSEAMVAEATAERDRIYEQIRVGSQAKSRELIADATAERDRIWEQIRIGVGRATKQIGDLLRIREELRLDLRQALEGSQHALRRLEQGGEEPAISPAPPAWLPEIPAAAPSTPAAPAPSPARAIPGRASEPARRASPLSPSASGAAPTPAAPAAEVAATSPLTSLRAGPFESFLAVMRFERALAALPAIDAVYVRRFSNGEVDVEVEPAAGGNLAADLGGMAGVETVKADGRLLRVSMHAEAPE